MYRFIRNFGLIVGLIFSQLLATSQLAQAWWNEAWTYRKVITVDTTATGLELTEATGEVTLLVRLHTGNFGYFFDIREGGADLRFMAGDDLTPLKHHVEKLDPINEIGLFWVKIPALQLASSDKIYMYYANQAAVTANDIPGSFNPEVDALVLHFDETDIPQDKTINANNPVSSSAEVSKASLIGQGALFNGAAALQFAASPTLAISSDPGWTFTAWVKPDAEAADVTLLEYTDLSTTLSIKQQGQSLVAVLKDASGEYQTAPTQPLLMGDWQHVALVIQANQMLLYINGANPVAVEIPTLFFSGNMTLGNSAASVASVTTSDESEATSETELANEGETLSGFSGELDEVRVATTARPAAWLIANADNQGKLPRLLVYGGDESQESEGSADAEGGGGGYFGIIISNVFGNSHAIVEQIVIGFCGFMAIIAFIIMFYKSYTIFSAKAASKKFLQAYEALGAQAENFDGLFDADEEFANSPQFRVYKQGIKELRSRMSPAVGSQFSGLEMKSINAIKSTLDATMVREGQRINSLIVMLTIAISGGPFIGLLGTVVGVMVTFAGIAAAGEVNINAIAPGMAAALLATVAGLGVAIPALFGYNYLGSHIRELSADMHVFAEEFMARLTESFGR